MMRYAALVFLSFLSVAYGGWLFTSICGRPELGGFATNGNCVPIDKNNTYYKKIECLETGAVESVCWDPMCENCKETDKTRLDTCDNGVTVTCYDEDIIYEPIVGKNYALVLTYRDSNCSSVIMEEAAFPTNICIASPSGGSMLMTCNQQSVMATIFGDEQCGSRMDSYTLAVGKCDGMQHASCYSSKN